MDLDLKNLKARIKDQITKDFEADKDRVIEELIRKRISFTAYYSIGVYFREDKDFIVDSVLASEYGQNHLLLDNQNIYVWRIRYK